LIHRQAPLLNKDDRILTVNSNHNVQIFDFKLTIICCQSSLSTTNQKKENKTTNLNDARFYERYRLKKEVERMIVQETEDRLECTTDRNHPLTPLQQILLALRFYATGSFEIVIGDMNGVSKATVSRYVKKVSDVAYLPRGDHTTLTFQSVMKLKQS
ncbi:hypothetical protein C0J52_22209, partial [Blattella germanica]